MKYCIMTGFNEQPSHDAAGFYQWANVFNGSIVKAAEILPVLKDGHFDIIHIRLVPGNLDSILRLRKQLGDRPRTKIICSLDIPAERWDEYFPDREKLLTAVNKSDFVFATEYAISRKVEEISGKKVYELPHPADIGLLKSYKFKEKKKVITILYRHKIENLPLLKLAAGFLGLKLRMVLLHRDEKSYPESINKKGMEVLVCENDMDFCKRLSESELVMAPYSFANYGRQVIYAAAMGCLVIGNNKADALRRCYSAILSGTDRMVHYFRTYLWLKYNPEVKNHITGYAADKVEYYNYPNLRKKILDIIYKETSDRRFNYHNRKEEIDEGTLDFFKEIRYVSGKKDIQYNRDEFIVVTLEKNGSEYISTFINHYRKLGASHIIIIDNGSTDGTIEKLSGYKDVTVYQTGLPHKKYESEIRRTVIEEHCRDRWCLYADFDELFDFPYSDRISMKQFLQYLNKNNYTAVMAYMLDMFARNLSFSDTEDSHDLAKKYQYYDISNIKKGEYFSETRAFNNYNSLTDKKMKYYFGGMRRNLFKSSMNRYLITKHPLMFINGILEPITSPHYCNKALIADVTGLIKHYKFISTFKKRVEESVNSYELFTNNEFKAYQKVIAGENKLYFFSKKAKYFISANNLVKQGFLKISDRYRRYAGGK